MARANNLGYPRIGKHRERKRATEGDLSGKVSAGELAEIGSTIRRANWETQQAAGIELIPSNDFSLYDQMLDTIALVAAVPDRYHWSSETVDLDTYFAMARGAQRKGLDVTAMEMTKWFDTNYHYLVPEFEPEQQFRLASTKPFAEFEEAKDLGIITKPVLIGPVSFPLLGKSRMEGFDPLDLLDSLLPVYQQVIKTLAGLGAKWIQLDEPSFVQDRSDRDRAALVHAYEALATSRGSANLLVQTYFDHVGDSYEALASLPVQGLGLDFVRGAPNLQLMRDHGFPENKALAAGIVDGRNIWIANMG